MFSSLFAVDAQVRPDPHDWRMTQGWPFRYFGLSSLIILPELV